MERDEIVRDDFPTARKGWDPDAVRAHLSSLAERLPSESVSIGDVAAERVGTIVGAAEATAAEIEAGAREQAEAIAAAAREEAREIVERARSEAQRRLDQAQAAVEGLLGQAEALRSQVGSPGAGPEPAPGPVVEAAPKAAAALAPEPASEPERAGETEAGSARDSGPAAARENDGPPATDEPDLAGARLVAMSLALEGADRGLIADRLESEFGALDGVEEMLDDVLARAGRA
jgi:cell division septum initiation protein DivIVA